MKIALIQLNSGPTVAGNLEPTAALIREAAAHGASFIATPENTCRMAKDNEQRWAESFEEKDHPAIPFYAALAKELSVTLLIGSLSSVRVGDKLANRTYLFAPDGGIRATYDKIHLFDVDLENGETYRESDLIKAGSRLVVSEVEGIPVGMTICYDMRFPHLYRELGKKGVAMITVPAAFTVPTGKAHWETLLRARAIENGAYVVAPAQGGVHASGRATYGHSMVVDPWGHVIAHKADDAAGILYADIDPEAVKKARASIPSLKHDRAYS